MGGFGFFGRKSLPDLDEEINLDDASLKDDNELLNELKQELEQLKVHNESKPKTTRKHKTVKLKDFKSIVEIEYFLKDIDDDFFKTNRDTIKKKIIDFIDKVLPETALSFEISLIGEKDKLLDKIHVIREVYGDLTLKGSPKKSKAVKDDSQESPKQSVVNDSAVEDTKKEATKEEKTGALTSESEEQMRAIQILRLVEPDKSIRIGDAKVRSLEELKNLVESLPEKEFNLLILPLHKRKNISKWIEHVLGYPELAEKLMLCETREEIQSVMGEMYTRIKDVMLYGKSIEPEEHEDLDLLKDHGTKKDAGEDKPQDISTKDSTKQSLTLSSTKEGKAKKDSKKKKEKTKKSKDLKSWFSSKSSKENASDEEIDEDEEIDDSNTGFEQQTKKSLTHILDQLPLLSEEEFAQKKDEILKALYKNKLSEQELAIFFSCSNKSEFTDALEEYLYSKPEFENRLKAIDKQELNKIIKKINIVIGEPLEDVVKETVSETGTVSEQEPNKAGFNETKTQLAKEESESSLSSEPQKTRTEELIKKALADESNQDNSSLIQEDKNQSSEPPLTQEILTEGFSQPTDSYKKASSEQLKTDDDFFNYVSELKQELEQMKQKNNNLLTLPPPTLDDRHKISSAEKGLFDLVKPEVNEEAFLNNKPITKESQPLAKQSIEQKQQKILDLEQQQKSTMSRYADIERELLKKEHEILQKKLELLKKRREEEERNLNLLLENIKLHDKVLAELSESSSKPKIQKSTPQQTIKNSPSVSTTIEEPQSFKESTTDFKLEASNEKQDILESLSASLKEFSSQLNELQPSEPASKGIQYSKSSLKNVQNPQVIGQQVTQQTESRNKEFKEIKAAISKIKDSLHPSDETTTSDTSAFKNKEIKPKISTVMDNIDDFSLNDLITVVDEFLLNDSFNEAKQIIVEAKKLIGKRSKKQMSAELRELKELAKKLKDNNNEGTSIEDTDSKSSNNIGYENKNTETILENTNKKTDDVNKESNISETNKNHDNSNAQKTVAKIDSNHFNKLLDSLDEQISNNDLDVAYELIQEANRSLKENFPDAQDN